MSKMEQVQREAERLTDRLRKLRDEVKVKARLAKMDAEDVWEETTRHIDRTVAQLETFARDWEASSDDARTQLQLRLLEAQERASLIQERVEGVWKSLEASGKKIEQQVEVAGLRAHLAKMDAEGFLRDKRARFVQMMETSREKATEGIQESLREVTGRLESFFDKLR